jgi:hypothetical protein
MFGQRPITPTKIVVDKEAEERVTKPMLMPFGLCSVQGVPSIG